MEREGVFEKSKDYGKTNFPKISLTKVTRDELFMMIVVNLVAI